MDDELSPVEFVRYNLINNQILLFPKMVPQCPDVGVPGMRNTESSL